MAILPASTWKTRLGKVKRYLSQGDWRGLVAEVHQFWKWKRSKWYARTLALSSGLPVSDELPFPPDFDRARLDPHRFDHIPLADRKLHIGCGQNYLEGWINIDVHPYSKADLVWDVTLGLPFGDNSVSLIHSEDFIEHISLEAGRSFFQECFRVLEPGSVMRVLTPDLLAFARCYVERDDGAMKWYAESFGVRTFAEMFNYGMRMGGHTFVYDEETLDLVLGETGFEVIRASFNQSCHPGLCDIDIREGGIPIHRDCRKPV